MNKKKFKAILIALLLCLTAVAFAQDEIKVVRFTITYDTNFDRLNLTGIKTLYDYASQNELPGNATLSTLSASGQKLDSVRLALFPPQILYSYSILDENLPYNEIKPPDTGTKDVFMPYKEEIEKVSVKVDGIEKPFEFNVKERLCNQNNACDPDETALSCKDCPMDKEDGICVWLEDTYCDPDCARGVDPDCLKTMTPQPTQTIQGQETVFPGKTVQPTPTPQPEGNTNYLLIGGIAAVFIILIIFYFVKSGREK
ncbi:MAG: hypothetical protein QXK06_05880 [Candidatus Diapherotrites archaeon]